MKHEAAPRRPSRHDSRRQRADRAARLVCRKFDLEYSNGSCTCPHPRTYCKFRTQCLVHNLCADSREN
jgi:hypothetical protein